MRDSRSPPLPAVPPVAPSRGAVRSRCATARLVAITDAATGKPVALGSVSDSIDVLTLVAFGPGEQASRQGGRVELVVRGSTDTTLMLPLSAPAPSVVAHAFRIAGLRSARYTAVVRLRSSSGQPLAESIPMHFEVVQR